MQLKDEDIWAIAIGVDFSGVERHFLVYANRRGFTIRSRTRGTHSTLKELTESNVREEIAFVHRTSIDRFRHRPRLLHSMSSNEPREARLPSYNSPMSEVERITRGIMCAMKAQPAVPMPSYQIEATILAHAIEALSSHSKLVEIDATRCIIGHQPSG
jgi:hypothetical protein